MQSLLKPEELLDMALNEAPHAIVITSDEGVVLSWGRAAEALFGWSAEEAVGTNIERLTGLHGDAVHANPVKAAGEQMAVSRQMVMRRHKDGRLLHVEVSWRTVDGASNGVRYRVASKRDVTAEQLVRDVELVQGRYRDLLDSVPDSIVIANDAGSIVLLNAEAARMFGVSAESMIGAPVESLIPERFAKAHTRHREGFAAAPQRRPMGSGLELRGRRGNGSEFPVEVSLSPLSLGDRQFSMAALRDRSERIQFEEAKRAAQDAQLANSAKTEFLSRMSHELRTPLNSVLGFAELLQEDLAGKMTDSQGQFLNHVIRAAESLLTLINDVLDISQIEGKSLSLQMEPTAIGPLLEEVVTAMLPMARRQQIVLELCPCGELGLGMVDRRRMVQVLLNLASNGIKYNRPGGRVRVSVEPRNEPSQSPGWWIHVADTGQGLTPEQLQRLGEPFNRLGAERSGIEGTGIGLTISRSLLDAMGCELLVRSEVGQGSTFSFAIKAAPLDTGLITSLGQRPGPHLRPTDPETTKA